MERPQKGSLGIPSVGGDAVKETEAVKAANTAQQTLGGGAFVFAGEDRLHIQHQIGLGSTQVAKDVTVVILGPFELLAWPARKAKGMAIGAWRIAPPCGQNRLCETACYVSRQLIKVSRWH
jgi:hypothetical protein